jgi:predicted RNase H-like nuclease (RuvC/YqgF family)
MWYLRALSVAVVVVPLVVGTGCVTKQVYDRDIQVERAKTTQANRELAQAKTDLKARDAQIADLSQKAADAASLRQQLADAQKRAEVLQASLTTAAANAKKMQEHADAEKMAAVTRAERGLREQLVKAHEHIAALTKEVEKLKREPTTPPVGPPAATPPTTTPPVTPPVSPN